MKVRRIRLQKLDAAHRRDARQGGTPDPETIAYMEILRRDPCAYCGASPAGTIDHMMPLALGGAHHWTNLTAACETCNKSKNDKGLLHYLLWRIGVL